MDGRDVRVLSALRRQAADKSASFWVRKLAAIFFSKREAPGEPQRPEL
jgi:hypothetical protein